MLSDAGLLLLTLCNAFMIGAHIFLYIQVRKQRKLAEKLAEPMRNMMAETMKGIVSSIADDLESLEEQLDGPTDEDVH